MGVALTLLSIIGIAVFVSSTRLPRALKRLVYAALMLRVVGSIARYVVLFGYYGGSGDARGYYARGLAFAARFRRLDFSPFFDSSLWYRGQWTGTSFISFPSGIILSVIGPSLLGEFIAFSLLAFLGLVGFAVAFKRNCPHRPLSDYVRWIWLFPSLWFWPSSVGKDALILMGLGLAMWGLFGPRGRKNWILIFIGTFIITAIRPQVAAVFLLSVVLAQWLSLGGRWTARRVVQGGLILGLGIAGIVLAMSLIGVDALDPDGVQEYLAEESAAAATSGTAVEEVGFSLTGVPIAILNIVARPFVWEATSVMTLASALEILLFWAIVWYRRRNAWAAIRSWRSHPLLRIAVPFVVIYSATLGMVVYNLGIIARQRIFLFPFLFMLLEVVPPEPVGRMRTRSPRPRGPHRLSLSPYPSTQRR